MLSTIHEKEVFKCSDVFVCGFTANSGVSLAQIVLLVVLFAFGHAQETQQAQRRIAR